MKYIKIFKLFASLLFVSQIVSAQDQNPSVAAVGKFEEYPVDLFTGAPQVSIPIYSMPTRSQDVNINLSLSYHPSAPSEFNKDLGNAGRGWSLNCGGIVGRNIIGDPDEKSTWNMPSPVSNDYYYYNFHGYSGKFMVQPYANVATVIENKSAVIRIEIQYDPESLSDIKILRFYDPNGYCYVFSTVEKLGIQLPGVPIVNVTISNSFQLTEIRDNNNQLLATYHYTDQGRLKLLNGITVPGYGKIQIHQSIFNWHYISDIVVRDVFENPVKKVVFDHGLEDSDGKYLLTELRTGDYNDTEVQTYKMYYSSPEIFLSLPEEVGTDQWGYPNITHISCAVDPYVRKQTDNDYCFKGVLEKMIMPTGGSIIYGYEAHTYSNESNNYTERTNLNKHNFTETFIAGEHYFNPSYANAETNSLSFTIDDDNSLYYAKLSAEQYDPGLINPGGGSSLGYPRFNIYNSSGTLIQTIDNYAFAANNPLCNGTRLYLAPGNYTMRIAPYNKGKGKASISKVALNPVIKEWWHGGGIRIKKIGYFTQEDVLQSYYHNPLYLDKPAPSREISFGYNFFGNPNRSSGYISPDCGLGSDAVRYQNVTVSDSKYGGRTEYTYTNGFDFPLDGSCKDSKTGRLMETGIFDAAGSKKKEIIYTHIDEDSSATTYDGYSYRFGWSGISEVLTKEYFPSGNIQTLEKYYYNPQRHVALKKVSTSRSTDTLSTRYFYHLANSIYSNNRSGDIERVEQYLNEDLLSVAKTIYSNSWSNPQASATVNAAYLPQQIQAAKAGNTLETKSRVNLYDEFGHPMEIQTENGIKKCMIWGYNNTQVIAEIENVSYSVIPATLITEAQNASNTQDEAVLLNKLTALRNASLLSGSLITTYTYKPLVGVLSVTDPRGYKITNEYDAFGRLIRVKDQNGNILNETQYHNKPN